MPFPLQEHIFQALPMRLRVAWVWCWCGERLLGYLLMVYRERQYKRKIKLWNLRKNANVGDYSHITDQLMQAPSKVPLGDVFMSQGIPITDDKIRRYVRHKGKKVPAAAESQVPPPPASTRDPSTSGRVLADDPAAHPWSPPTADETTPEPDNGSSTSRLMELERQAEQGEKQLRRLRAEIAMIRMSNERKRDAAGSQDILDRGKRTGPQQTTQQQPRTQPHYHIRTSQKQDESKGPGHVPPQQAVKAAKAPAPEILAVREANAKKSWRTVTINGAEETNPFEESFKAAMQPNRAAADAQLWIDKFGPGAWADLLPPAAPVDGKARRTNLLGRQFRALYPEVESSAAVAAVTASEPDDPHQGLGQFSVEWISPPIRTGVTLGAIGNMWPALFH